MNMRCEICGLTNDGHRMGFVRCGELVKGKVQFRQREICPRCMGRYGIALPTGVLRDLVETAVVEGHQRVIKLVEEATNAAPKASRAVSPAANEAS
jgi:hypothetical protein